MTREEAKRRLLNIERCTPIHTREDARDFEALEMAIQALEQEPCTDSVSVEAVIEWLKDKDIIKLKSQEENARKELQQLYSVKPQEPMLDKIRAEIDKWHHLTDKAFNDGIDTALEIIDKHIGGIK